MRNIRKRKRGRICDGNSSDDGDGDDGSGSNGDGGDYFIEHSQYFSYLVHCVLGVIINHFVKRISRRDSFAIGGTASSPDALCEASRGRKTRDVDANKSGFFERGYHNAASRTRVD